jgi:hypothetical protein
MTFDEVIFNKVINSQQKLPFQMILFLFRGPFFLRSSAEAIDVVQKNKARASVQTFASNVQQKRLDRLQTFS